MVGGGYILPSLKARLSRRLYERQAHLINENAYLCDLKPFGTGKFNLYDDQKQADLHHPWFW